MQKKFGLSVFPVFWTFQSFDVQIIFKNFQSFENLKLLQKSTENFPETKD